MVACDEERGPSISNILGSTASDDSLRRMTSMSGLFGSIGSRRIANSFIRRDGATDAIGSKGSFVKYAKRPPTSTANDRKQMAAMVQGLRLPIMAEPPAENLLEIALPYYYTKKETSETRG
jgi:hypothetical protein